MTRATTVVVARGTPSDDEIAALVCALAAVQGRATAAPAPRRPVQHRSAPRWAPAAPLLAPGPAALARWHRPWTAGPARPAAPAGPAVRWLLAG
jgi:hypothetical protein